MKLEKEINELEVCVTTFVLVEEADRLFLNENDAIYRPFVIGRLICRLVEQDKFSQLSSENEKLEMEVLLARSAGLNGNDPSSVSDEDDDGQPNIYKQKYERAARELEFTKQRLLQQHEDDVEQMVSIKKQLEKKLNDAYEEVEEQRQVVSQWKRKSQRLASELSDTRLLHEEQTNRNSLLEKKQRKYVVIGSILIIATDD